MIHKILAVQNCGPSGTTLLQSLFDGHPQVLSLPALHGQTLLIFWEHFWPLSKDELYVKFIKDYEFYFNPDKVTNLLGLRELGANKNEIAYVDKNLFLHYLQEDWQTVQKLTRKQFLCSIYIAYNKALGRDICSDPYILYPIHCLPERFAKYLVEDFEVVKFLHTIREPIQSIGSLASHINKNSDWDHHYLLSCVTAQMLCDHTIHVGPHAAHGMYPYVQDSKDGLKQSRAIRLEDIHHSHSETLHRVCNWLQIPWSEKLKESTYNGKAWHNRPESMRLSGIDTKLLKQKQDDLLSKFDIKRLNYLTTHFKIFYDYVNIPTSKLLAWLMPLLIYLPFKMELRKERFHKQKIFEFFSQYLLCRTSWLKPAIKNANENSKNYVPLL